MIYDERRCMYLSALVSNARVIFDVGAHQGRITEYYLKYTQATIYAFEAEPGNYRVLKARLAVSRVKPVHAAVFNRSGEVGLNLAGRSTMHSLLKPTDQYLAERAKTRRPRGIVKVPAITLDDFCAERKIDRIDILKVDTEGTDLAVLEGARRLFEEKRIGFVCIELMFYPYCKNQCSAESVIMFLRNHGFRLDSLWGPKRDGGRITYADGIFVKRDFIR